MTSSPGSGSSSASGSGPVSGSSLTPSSTSGSASGSTLHRDAVDLLRAWSPPDTEQGMLREDYLRHLERHGDGLSRTCFPDHVTASTLIVSADRTQALLTLHAKAQQWFQMGGHCEVGDTTLAGAALREAVEESGITDLVLDPAPVQLSPHDVAFCDPRGTVRHLDVRFLALAPTDATHAVSEESLDVRWWPIGELPTREPEILALVDLSLTRLVQSTSSAAI